MIEQNFFFLLPPLDWDGSRPTQRTVWKSQSRWDPRLTTRIEGGAGEVGGGSGEGAHREHRETSHSRQKPLSSTWHHGNSGGAMSAGGRWARRQLREDLPPSLGGHSSQIFPSLEEEVAEKRPVVKKGSYSCNKGTPDWECRRTVLLWMRWGRQGMNSQADMPGRCD